METTTQFKKGKEKGPGRPKGTPNKTPAAIKDMILQALENAGGVEYLEAKAKDNRTATAFLGLVGKVLPLQVHGAGPNGEHVFQRIVREVVDPK
jgi:hypothetical protein